MAKVGEITTPTDVTLPSGSGTTILNGARAPLEADGAVGAYWHDTAGKALWGPKAISGASGYAINPATVPDSLASPPNDFTLGMRMQFLAPVSVTGLRFYRSASSTTTARKLTFYREGVLQATLTTNPALETGSGWKTMTLGSPITVDVGANWYAAFYTGNSYYVETLTVLPSYTPSIVTLMDACYAAGDQFPANSVGYTWFASPVFTLPAWSKVLQSAP